MAITLFSILVLVISASFHEYMHGWVAYKLGDPTAKHAGRLTLNPMAHLEPFSSIILPLMLILANSPFLIAAAKPVPYNPNNLRDQKYGDLKVALGGPGANLLLAIAFGLLARFISISALAKQNLILAYFTGENSSLLSSMQGSVLTSIFVMSFIFCFINLLLMIFNLIPVPPLDGSKILSAFLPYNLQMKMRAIEPYGFFILIILLLMGVFSVIWPVLIFLFFLLVGF